jgi:hypothetical protein
MSYFLRSGLSATERPSWQDKKPREKQARGGLKTGSHSMPDGHCRGETLHHEIPISTARVPEKMSLRVRRRRLGGSGHIKTRHLASKSRVMLTTPKVLARDTITSEILSIFLLLAAETSDSVWIS